MLLGVTNSHFYDTAYNLLEIDSKFVHYIAGYYEQKPVDIEKLENQSAQNTVEYTPQTKIDLAYNYKNEKKTKCESDLTNVSNNCQILAIIYLQITLLKG